MAPSTYSPFRFKKLIRVDNRLDSSEELDTDKEVSGAEDSEGEDSLEGEKMVPKKDSISWLDILFITKPIFVKSLGW